jgi:UDP-N-acetylmuramate dehydrogenase
MEKINTETPFKGDLAFDEPLKNHTTFKVGGPADVWVRPEADVFPSYVERLGKVTQKEGVPLFFLGGGANLVVSDRGIRGVVVDTTAWTGWNWLDGAVEVRSGTAVDTLADACGRRGAGGLEFLAGMPGTIGGALWMNARCYGSSVSDVLLETTILDEGWEKRVLPFRPEDFSYKRSPFQGRSVLILLGRFRLISQDPDELQKKMCEYRMDRETKGHYRFPSAGSAFKNNRDFGKPTGMIIDELGLRGLRLGGAEVAPWHGNIIINRGSATAQDIRRLTEVVAQRVLDQRGLRLECEILFVGEWD